MSVPKINHAPLEAKNFVGKVLYSRHGVYEIGTKPGIIKNWFSRPLLNISSNEYKYEIPETLMSLREAVTKESMFGDKDKVFMQDNKNQFHAYRSACFQKKFLSF